MNIYTLKQDAKVLGERHPDYGYTYWAYVHESDFPVKFSSHKTGFLEGRKIVADEQEKRQGKKSEYLQLKKVQLADSGSPKAGGQVPTNPSPAMQASQSPGLAVGHFNLLMKELRDINKKVDKLMGEETVIDDPAEIDKPITEDDMPEDFLT